MFPIQSAITRKREIPQPHVFIFFLISSSFSISSTISRGKAFRGDPKISLFRYIKSLVTKYQIWYPWAMIILWGFFLNNSFFIFSIFLFSFLFSFIYFCYFYLFIYFWLAAMGCHAPLNTFRRYSNCLCDGGFKIDSLDFYSQKSFWQVLLVKGYLIKSKPKYNFNKWLSKNNFQFFYLGMTIIPSKAAVCKCSSGQLV